MRNDPLSRGTPKRAVGGGVVAQLLGLSAEQVDRICLLLPKERSVKRVNDRKVLSGIISVIQKGLRWVDAPAGPWSPQNHLQLLPPLVRQGCF